MRFLYNGRKVPCQSLLCPWPPCCPSRTRTACPPPSARASSMAAGCTSAIPPRRLRTHTRRGSSPGEKFDEWEGKGLTHPEKLLSSRDAEFAEDRTIVVRYFLPLREFVTVEKSPNSPFLMFLVATRNISLPMLILTVFGLQSLLK